MTLLLVGNPNAGKSTLFNGLTGKNAKVGNWHGVTVGATEGKTTLGNTSVGVCDLPGIYALDTYSLEEEITRERLKERDAVVLFVAECSTLPRVLPLLKQVSERKKTCLVLTKKHSFQKRGGKLNVELLSERLGIPVYEVNGRSRRSVSQFKARLLTFLHAPMLTCAGVHELPLSDYTPEGEHLSVADEILYKSGACIGLFLLVLVATFYLAFAPSSLGSLVKDKIEWLFCDLLAGQAEGISSPVVKSFLVDGVLKGVGGVLCFLPQVGILFLTLTFLEESGFLSRLAMHVDGVFSKMGLNGRAIFSLLMGFGCTAAAVLSTRGMENKRMQRRTVLCLPYLSCSAKLPVFLTLSVSFFDNAFLAAVFLYALGVLVAIVVALLIKRENSPPLLLELAPLQLPNPLFLAKSLLFQLKQFIIKTATVILACFLLSWLLSSFSFSFAFCAVEESMLATLCGWLKWLFAPIGCNDWKIAYAALSGLIAKENIAGLISVFYGRFPYSAASGFALSAFVLTCSPCVSAITATARELGVRRALLYAVLQTATALLFSYLVYFAARGGWPILTVALIGLFFALLLGKACYEKVRRQRKHHLKGVYR